MLTVLSVNDWIFACDDWMAQLLRPDGSCAILLNHTAYPPTTAYTGKDDISKINTYIKWREQTELANVWNAPVPMYLIKRAQ